MNTENMVCSKTPALGMESKAIQNSQITASSSFPEFQAFKGRLNNNKYWVAENLTDPWIQVDLQDLTRVSGIITQGSSNSSEWVKMLQIQYGRSEDILMYILQDDEPKVSIFVCFWHVVTSYKTTKLEELIPASTFKYLLNIVQLPFWLQQSLIIYYTSSPIHTKTENKKTYKFF